MEQELIERLDKIQTTLEKVDRDTLVNTTEIKNIKGVEKEVKVLSKIVIQNVERIKSVNTEVRYVKWVLGSIFLIVAVAGTILKAMK